MSTQAKKEYETPKVVYTETLQGRAVVCARSDDANCAGGPLQS